MSARIAGSILGTLILVPGTVLCLLDMGVAGSWKWFPACLVLVAGLAGCLAAALWWRRRRMRLVAACTAFIWAVVALGVAYSPAVATRTEIRAAFDRVHYDQALVDPYVDELGGTWCGAGFTDFGGCPWLLVDYLVDEGQGMEVVRALEDAGFEMVGEPQRRPLEDVDLPGSGLSAMGSRYWLKGNGMRLEVTVISERAVAVALPVGGEEGITTYVSPATERVSVEMSDAKNAERLGGSDDLGFWTPDAGLSDVEPPPGW
ncbi:hypothetical protein EXE58_11285 [Nocardioides seonyuensis]|uniref:Uncharacterized protein n=1 Tax=Nocardioides seonyuensis TaxID=2518371 RepID=A0A4P7IFH4_9ACTN|nr:hypothetical protein [Nocardioides seonyuensis]QBX55986.1 hypothetical protein EXE58_11285 [Nocardioides seonyuensis]